MFNGNLDADPSELPGATAVSSHVEAACLQHILLAPARKSRFSERSNILAQAIGSGTAAPDRSDPAAPTIALCA
jgi:hypothetical protein